MNARGPGREKATEIERGGTGRRKTLTITARVHPRSRKPGVRRLGPHEYSVYVASPPEKGAANREAVAALAAHWGIPASSVRIVRGEKSRSKFILLELED